MIQKISQFLKAMHDESVFKALEYSHQRLEDFVSVLVTSPDGLVLAIGDPIEAVFIGEAYAHFASEDKVAVDHIMYVHPDHRRKGYASKLLNEYKEWAKSRNAKMVFLGVTTGIPGAEDFFESHGLTPLGRNYGMW